MTMHNKRLKVGVVPSPRFAVIKKDKNGHDIIGGLFGKFFEYMRNARNCTFNTVVPIDRMWGNCYGQNNCTGMIGLVNREEVDFAIGI